MHYLSGPVTFTECQSLLRYVVKGVFTSRHRQTEHHCLCSKCVYYSVCLCVPPKQTTDTGSRTIRMSKPPLRICYLPISLWKSKTSGLHITLLYIMSGKDHVNAISEHAVLIGSIQIFCWWDISICEGRFGNLSAFGQDPDPDDAFGFICISQCFICRWVRESVRAQTRSSSLSVLMLRLLIISAALLLFFHHTQFVIFRSLVWFFWDDYTSLIRLHINRHK